ncbi:manganese efflux pump MntP family protein [Candidatus Lokiarchaeum ossiferum]
MITFTTIISMLMLGIGLSMDSLALSVSCGLQATENKKQMALKVGFIFAFVQASTPLLGYFLGSFFAEQIAFIDHWIAFGLLGFIGGHMLKEGIVHNNGGECEEKDLTLLVLFTMGIATSIDALAAGISLIATDLPILWTIIIIFGATLGFSLFGYSFGNKLGTLFQSRAEIFGGIVLIGLGIKILIEHLLLM